MYSVYVRVCTYVQCVCEECRGLIIQACTWYTGSPAPLMKFTEGASDVFIVLLSNQC